MQKTIAINKKDFELLLTSDEIQRNIVRIAEEINNDYAGKNIHFICVLKGAFMFASKLMTSINLPCSISFIRISSYSGTSSSGKIKTIMGLNAHLAGKHVIVLEDIVDTGTTITWLIGEIEKHNPADISIATLCFKKSIYNGPVHIKYAGFEISNRFVAGFGMDYEEYGRTLKNIYRIKS